MYRFTEYFVQYLLTSVLLLTLISGCGGGGGGVAGPKPEPTPEPEVEVETGTEADLLCKQMNYPCSVFDVPSEIRKKTTSIGQAAYDKVASGVSIAEIADELRANEAVVEVVADETALFFRIEGGAPFFILSEAIAGASQKSTTSKSSGKLRVVGDDPEEKHALVLSPYRADFSPFDEGNEVSQILNGTRGYKGNVTYLADNAVGKRAWMNWGQYDIVHVSTHGAYFCSQKSVNERCLTVIHTGISASEVEDGPWTGIGGPLPGVYRAGSKSSPVLVLTDDFFNYLYSDGLGDTIIWMNACETTKSSAGNEGFGLWEILTFGGGVYFGWTETVASGTAHGAAIDFYKFMSENGTTTKSAFEEVKKNGNGQDGGSPPAILTRAQGKLIKDLRLREIIWALDPLTGTEITDGFKYLLNGIPQDGKTDSLSFAIRVDGVEEGQAAEFTVHVSVNGVKYSQGGWSLDDGKKTKEYTWLLEKEVGLLFDAKYNEKVNIRAWVDLPDGDLSEQTVTVILTPPDLVLSWDSRIEIDYPDESPFKLHADAKIELDLKEDGSAYIGSGTLNYLLNNMPEDACTMELVDGVFQVIGLTFPSMPSANKEIELTYTFNPGPKEVHTCSGGGFEFALFTTQYSLLHLMLGEVTDPDAKGFVTVGWDTNVKPPLIARKVIDYALPQDDGTVIIEKTTFEIRKVMPQP